ncbi:hypothetical protein NOVO_02085 [Rickettsiales bacterium Ac37b]|nr:hypothetical protein NOVO_02085 [Rickettsiales bacterium Ac37b]
MFVPKNKYHHECAKEVKINKNEFPIWIEQQDSKINGFIKLLDHTLVRCDQINNDVRISILELTENYGVLKRNFFRVAALYNHKVTERQYKYISLLLTKLNAELENMVSKNSEFLKEQLLLIELKISTDRKNLMKVNSDE